MTPDPDLTAKIHQIITRVTPKRYKKVVLTPDTQLNRDLGIDSLAVVAFAAEIEKEFNIDMTDLDLGTYMAGVKTVQDAVNTARAILSEMGICN